MAGLGRTSITYAFEVRSGASLAAAGRMVAVSSDPVGEGSEAWSDEVRSAFTTSGAVAPERFA